MNKALDMELHRDRLIELCRAIDESHNDPEEEALWAEMWESTEVDPEAVRRRALSFVDVGIDPNFAFELSRILEVTEAAEIFSRFDDMREGWPVNPETVPLRLELLEEVKKEPSLALELTLAELRLMTAGEGNWSTDLSEVLIALRTIDSSWLDVVIDLVPTEPALNDTVVSALADGELHLIVERLGVQRFTDSWLAVSADPSSPMGWATSLMSSDEGWASEEMRRAILLQLIADARGEHFWYVAAWPLEDFLNDDPERLEWMEQEAARNPRFLAALTGVWTSGKSPQTAARIAAIAPDEESEPEGLTLG